MASGGHLRRACRAARFTGAFAEICEVLAPMGINASRVLLVGLGDIRGRAPRSSSVSAEPYARAFFAREKRESW